MKFPKLSILLRKIKADFRLKRILYTTISALGAKGVAVLVSFITLPLTLNFLGKERFGMMMVIVSTFSMMNFSDLGLGFSIQNRIPEFEDDEEGLSKIVSSTFFFLCVISFLLFVSFVVIHPYINWNSIFNVSSELAKRESSDSVFCFFFFFCLGLPFTIIDKIQGGFQEGYINNIWTSTGHLFGLAILCLAVSNNLGVPYVIISIYGSNTLFIIFNFWNQFLSKRRYLIPKVRKVDLDVIKIVLNDGFFFTIIQVLFLVFVASDNIIVTQILNPEVIAELTVGLRLVSLMVIPINSMMIPILPAVNDALEKAEFKWLNALFRKSFFVSILSSISLFLLFLVSANALIGVWLGEEHLLNKTIVISLGFYLIYSCMNPFYSYFMLSKYLIRKYVKIYSIAVILVIIAKIIFCYLYGLEGLLIATSILMIMIYFIPSHKTITDLWSLRK